MRVIDRAKLTGDVEIPHYVSMVLFDGSTAVTVSGGDVSFGSNDYHSVEATRAALDWCVEQLGGKVKWEKK